MATTRRLLAALAAMMLLAGAVTAQTSESNAKSFLWKQCNEDAINLYVDPAPFQELVPPGYTLLLFEGRAWVLVIAQDCPRYRLDGEEIGATHDVHMWVAIEGPQDVRPVVGAEQTLPTLTWFTVFTGSNNARGREIWTASGTPAVPIDSVYLDPPGPERGGRVVLSPEQSFSWQAQSAAPFARFLGVNHDVYEQDPGGNIVLNRIQALVNMDAFDSPGILEVVGGMGPEDWIVPGIYEVEVHSFFPVWARASLGEDPPE